MKSSLRRKSFAKTGLPRTTVEAKSEALTATATDEASPKVAPTTGTRMKGGRSKARRASQFGTFRSATIRGSASLGRREVRG